MPTTPVIRAGFGHIIRALFILAVGLQLWSWPGLVLAVIVAATADWRFDAAGAR